MFEVYRTAIKYNKDRNKKWGNNVQLPVARGLMSLPGVN